MKLNFRTLLTIFFFIIVQLLIENYLSLGVRIHITILPFLILGFSYKYSTISMMLIAFGLGLSVDIFGNGIIGLNAAALVAVAFTRESFLKNLVNQRSMENLSAPSPREMGLSPYIIYLIFTYSVFFIFFIPLESMSIFPFFQNLIKLILSIIINVILAYILSRIFHNKKTTYYGN